jgi:predicted ester cyclase
VSSEENKAVVQRFIEEVFVQHDPSNIEELVSNESLKQMAPGTVQAFPDMEMTVEQLISEGDLSPSG